MLAFILGSEEAIHTSLTHTVAGEGPLPPPPPIQGIFILLYACAWDYDLFLFVQGQRQVKAVTMLSPGLSK